jgi:DtxR family Mn-dependent transcriptional regulator
MMRKHLTPNIEDYLKAIFEINQPPQRVSTNQIAEALGVSAASVTGMLKKLSDNDPPLVVYQKHHGASLTSAGEQVALEILRHHRLLEMYLVQVLGYDWDQVHQEADRLEHVISEDFEARIDQALGHPSHDPHGDPIPDSDLNLPESPTLRLFDLDCGDTAIIHRVGSENPELLRYLAEMGMMPKVTIKILDRTPYDQNLRLKLGDSPDSLILGPVITQQIFVERLN